MAYPLSLSILRSLLTPGLSGVPNNFSGDFCAIKKHASHRGEHLTPKMEGGLGAIQHPARAPRLPPPSGPADASVGRFFFFFPQCRAEAFWASLRARLLLTYEDDAAWAPRFITRPSPAPRATTAVAQDPGPSQLCSPSLFAKVGQRETAPLGPFLVYRHAFAPASLGP